MKLEPLQKEAIENARKKNIGVFQIAISWPIAAEDKAPKLCMSASGMLPNKYHKQLIKLITKILTES